VGLLAGDVDWNPKLAAGDKARARRLLEGAPGQDARAGRAGEYLDAADQVAVLLELAQDPNIVGRCWQGLQLWV